MQWSHLEDRSHAQLMDALRHRDSAVMPKPFSDKPRSVTVSHHAHVFAICLQAPVFVSWHKFIARYG